MLTERQLLILQVIIDDFIRTAQPVGSRAISKKKEVNYSSATIRNEMADLEELGYLEKTHSSSGRIPSEKGYRFYVDHLMSPFYLTKEELRPIRSMFNEKMMEFERIIDKSARILSDLTNYTSIILGPEVFETRLKQIQIVPLSPNSAVAILITNTGYVEHRTFSVPEELNPSDIEKTVNILNEKLKGVPIIDLKEKIVNEVAILLQKHIRNFEEMYHFLEATMMQDQPSKLYISGKTNILLQPEFKDLEKVRTLISMFDEETEIVPIIRSQTKGINVLIGHENEHEAMTSCSLITATYNLNDDHKGTIALLGPTRMDYSKVISLLNELSKQMTNTFKTWYQKS